MVHYEQNGTEAIFKDYLMKQQQQNVQERLNENRQEMKLFTLTCMCLCIRVEKRLDLNTLKMLISTLFL